MLLSVNRISKSFEDRAVLSDVSFDIGEGEIVGFLGPNGAGKTTAIKIILGLLTPNAGEVYIDGLNVRTVLKRPSATSARSSKRRAVRLFVRDGQPEGRRAPLPRAPLAHQRGGRSRGAVRADR